MSGLCYECKQLKPVAYTDSLDHDYCEGCFSVLSVPPPPTLMDFLQVTVPYRVGDRVECRTAGALFDGVGKIDQISTDLENYGTPVYPSFHVVIDDKAYPDAPDSLWYTESCLTKVDG